MSGRRKFEYCPESPTNGVILFRWGAGFQYGAEAAQLFLVMGAELPL